MAVPRTTCAAAEGAAAGDTYSFDDAEKASEPRAFGVGAPAQTRLQGFGGLTTF